MFRGTYFSFHGTHLSSLMKAPAAVSPLEAHVGYWLRLVSNQVSQAFARELEAREISVAEWVALRLAYQQDRIAPAQLSERAQLTRGAISKVIDKLESKGLLVRTADPDDGRAQQMSLTRRGRQLVPQLAALADANDERFFGCLTARDRATLMRLLRQLTDAHHLTGAPTD